MYGVNENSYFLLGLNDITDELLSSVAEYKYAFTVLSHFIDSLKAIFILVSFQTQDLVNLVSF